jgi:membrane protease YdiL (CAAX protease family)
VRAALWLRFALGTCVAFGSLLILSPRAPQRRVPAPVAAAIGAAAGLLLYVTVSRRRPFAPRGLTPAFGLLALAAANEELVWRRVVLGELLRSGPVAAAAGSTLGFALAHRAQPGLHLGTGAAFSALYLATGTLAACIAAHWIYNSFLVTLGERTSRRERPP